MRLIDNLIDLYLLIILIRVVMSWIHLGHNQFTNFIYAVTEPVLAPIRRAIPAMDGIDFSPMILLIIIYFIKNMLFGI